MPLLSIVRTSMRHAAVTSLLAVSMACLIAGCAQDGATQLASLDPKLPAVAGAVPPVEAQQPVAARRAAVLDASDAGMSPALAEARNKRRSGDRAGALALLDKVAQQNPKDPAVQKERGLLMLELGQVKNAETVLRAAIDAKTPDWRVHSGLGAALAAQGRQSDAQLQFAKALELAPDHASVLNNLALSYALDGKPAEAERILKQIPAAAAQAKRANQNLALLAGLGGRVQEAERLAAAALPVEQARSNAVLLEPASSGEAGAGGEAQRRQRAAAAPGIGGEASFRLGGPRD